MTQKKELIKNTLILGIGKLGTQLITFLLLPLFTYYISSSDYGYLDLIITYTALIVPTITLSIDMAAFRFIIDSRDNNVKKSEIISTSVGIISILLLIILLIFIPVSKLLNLEYTLLIILYIITFIYSNLFLQISRGLGDNQSYSISSFISAITTFFLSVIQLLLFKNGIKGILIAYIIGNLMCTIYLFFKIKIHKYLASKSINKKTLKKMVAYSLPLVPNSISWWIINASDKIIISLVLNMSAVGIYAVSNKISAILAAICGIFNLAWIESASKNIDQTDHQEYFSDVINTMIVIFSTVCLLIISLLPIFFDTIIGAKYMEAYQYIPILVIATLFNLIISLYSGIYIGKKMTKKIMSTSIFAAIINILVNIIFIKKYKLYAAAFSTLISFLSMMIYRGITLNKIEKIKYNYKSIIVILLLGSFVIITYYIKIIELSILSLILIIIFILLILKKNYYKIKSLLIKNN